MTSFLHHKKTELFAIAVLMVGYFLFQTFFVDAQHETNETRQQDLEIILSALVEYKNFNGEYPIAVDYDEETVQVITQNGLSCDTSCSQFNNVRECINLHESLYPQYLSEIPFDAQYENSNSTGYYINRFYDDRIVLGVCNAENQDLIHVMY